MNMTSCGPTLEASFCPQIYQPKYDHAFSMRYGLFIHWAGPGIGQGTGILHSDGKSIGIDIDEYASSIDVEKVADEIQELGFEYLVLTNFHGIGTMLNPCAASDDWRGCGYAAKRDVIGEMIQALKIRNIGFILFTHPLDAHDYREEDREKLGWEDPTDNYKRWNDFVNDVYSELIERYGQDIMGVGFDSNFGLNNNANWKDKLDLLRLRSTILSKAPHLQLYALAGPNDCCELGMKEIWRPFWLDPHGAFQENDFDVEGWPCYRRVMGIVQANHWTTIAPPEKGIVHLNAVQMYRYSVMQAAAATEGPGVAWAASPYADGSWERTVREVFAEVQNIRRDVMEALANVYPSTSYPTPEGSRLKDLPFGVVATKSVDDTVEYIHVMNPPSDGSKTLVLPMPQDNKVFLSAKVLRSGREVSLSVQENEEDESRIVVKLFENENWDLRRTTIIALEVDPASLPKKNLALFKSVMYSSSVQMEPRWPPRSNFGSIRVNNGRREVDQAPTSWSTGSFGWSSQRSNESREQWVGVDLAEELEVVSVVLYPRNDEGHKGEGFPNELSLEASIDGESWQCIITDKEAGIPPDGQPWSVSFDPIQCRFVRVVGHDLRQSADDSLFSMQIVEFEIYGPGG